MKKRKGVLGSAKQRERRPLMEMPEKHLGRQAAQDSVRETLRRNGIELPEEDWYKQSITINLPNKPSRLVTVHELIEEAQTSGVPETLQRILDLCDPFFGGTFVMATDSYALSLGFQYAGYTTNLQGPCRLGPIEEELTSDLLHFRRAACDASRPPSDLAASTRYYRGYLQASVSIVEAFINRYVQLLTHQRHPRASQRAERCPLEDRIANWVEIVTGKQPDTFRAGSEWSQFCELRNERNRLVHAVEPFMGHRVTDMVRGLNFVREGVGGLLILLRQMAGAEALGFMLKLRSASLVVARRD